MVDSHITIPLTHTQTVDTDSLLPAPEASCLLFVCALLCHAVPRPVFGYDVMFGQVPVEVAIGDCFPATALSLHPRKGTKEVGTQAYGREGEHVEDMQTGGRPVSQQTCNS